MSELPKPSLKSRITRILNPSTGAVQAALAVERERINRLEEELAELRRDSLRIAELTDLLENRLTPPSTES